MVPYNAIKHIRPREKRSIHGGTSDPVPCQVAQNRQDLRQKPCILAANRQ